MEPVSFAVGIIGLAGLFSTCLEAVERFDSYKNFGPEKPGKAAGLQETGQLQEKHNRLLDDQRIKSTVVELLSAIEEICQHEDETHNEPKSATERKSFRDQIWPKSHKNTQEGVSRRQKIGWALKTKTKRMYQVELFTTLVDTIYGLVPLDGAQALGDESAGQEIGGEDPDAALTPYKEFDKEELIAESRRRLHMIDKEFDEGTKRNVHSWLLGNRTLNELYEISVDKRVKGTCDWVFDRAWFKNWASPDFSSELAKILWINGPAGFGKSILCARVIEELSLSWKSPVAYFFFSSDFESRRDPFVAIRSWLSQLMSNETAFSLAHEREVASPGQRASRSDTVKLLHDIVTKIPLCTFVIDGLDECGWSSEDLKLDENDSVSSFLETIRRTIAGTQTRFLIKYREQEVVNRTEATKEDIALKLADRCNGQFLWVKMQEDFLRSGKSQKKIEQAINSTPIGLEQTYERNWMKLSRLPSEDRDRAISVLRWTAFALRPLTVNELTGALLVNDDCDEVRVDDMPDAIDEDYINTEILDLCGSLLEIRSPKTESPAELRTVHLAHFSVKQYLLANIPTQGSFLQLNSTLTSSTEAAVWLEKSNLDNHHILTAFRDYAAGSWQRHATVGDIRDEGLTELVNELFDPENATWASWKKWFDENDKEGGMGEAKPGSRPEKSEENSESSDHEDDKPTLPTSPKESVISDDDDESEADEGELRSTQLYYASWLGLTDTVNVLIDRHSYNINEKGNHGRTALVAACSRGHLEIVQMLLENGADMTLRDFDGHDSLTTASLNGHLEIVRLLVKRGADISVASNQGETSLYCAAYKGHFEILKLLIEKGGDIEGHNFRHLTPLNAASDGGHFDVVKLLVQKGADINRPDDCGRAPAHSASLKGHVAIVRLLLDKGADPSSNVQRGGWTPLNVAADNGHTEVVKLLLERGADMDAKEGSTQRGPLYSACDNGHIEIVTMLLAKGADTEDRIFGGITAIYVSAVKGRTEITKLLLEAGAKVNIQNEHGWSPLNAASEGGHLDVIKLLAQENADIELANNDGVTPIHTASNRTKGGWTPICVAASNGYREIVRVLLDAGADFEIAVKDSMITPLYGACYGGHTEIAAMLLAKGADPSKPNKSGWTPVNVAASNGHLEIVKMLLKKVSKEELAVPDEKGWTPVNAATGRGHTEVVRVLLEAGADYEASNFQNSATPLYSACYRGNIEIVKLLLGQGADYSKPNKNNWSPINVAASNGYTEIVKVLLHMDPIPDLAFAGSGGWTPVNAASDSGHTEIVRMLLDAGADYEAVNESNMTSLCQRTYRDCQNAPRQGADTSLQTTTGTTALTAASENGHFQIVKLLVAHGADIEQTNNTDMTPLYSAAYNGHTEIVRLLLKKGANYMKPNKNGWTPVCTASSNGHTQVIRLLMDQNPPPDLVTADTLNGWTPSKRGVGSSSL
ncbi:hypothetical protein N7470_004030 [Penicillium chermesinum]|nr:hypothetical protein N7470_004030 [Penicillium chermesinum]